MQFKVITSILLLFVAQTMAARCTLAYLVLRQGKKLIILFSDNAGHTTAVSWSQNLYFFYQTHYLSTRIVLGISLLLVLPLIYVNFCLQVMVATSAAVHLILRLVERKLHTLRRRSVRWLLCSCKPPGSNCPNPKWYSHVISMWLWRSRSVAATD